MSVDEVFLTRILLDYYGSPQSNNAMKPIQGNKFTPYGSRLDSSGCARLVQMENNLIEQNITENNRKKCKIAPSLLADNYRLHLKVSVTNGTMKCQLINVLTDPTASVLDRILVDSDLGSKNSKNSKRNKSFSSSRIAIVSMNFNKSELKSDLKSGLKSTISNVSYRCEKNQCEKNQCEKNQWNRNDVINNPYRTDFTEIDKCRASNIIMSDENHCCKKDDVHIDGNTKDNNMNSIDNYITKYDNIGNDIDDNMNTNTNTNANTNITSINTNIDINANIDTNTDINSIIDIDNDNILHMTNIAQNGFIYHGQRFKFLLSKNPDDKIAYFLRNDNSDKIFPNAENLRNFFADFSSQTTISKAGKINILINYLFFSYFFGIFFTLLIFLTFLLHLSNTFILFDQFSFCIININALISVILSQLLSYFYFPL